MSGQAAGGIIADIGGTNIRLALVGTSGEAFEERKLLCADFDGPAAAIRGYLDETGAKPRRAALAVASPVVSDRIAMTNNHWDFSIQALRSELGLDGLEVVNDFQAVALAVPHLAAGDLVAVGGGKAEMRAPIGVLGPGTGLGAAALVPHGKRFLALATEGGHVTLAARGARETAVALRLAAEFGHVSAERVVSGPGLVNLHRALAAEDGVPHLHDEPDDISEAACNATCPLCVEALDLFFAIFGTVAGNLALSLGARGGIVVAGGIIPRLLPQFMTSRFRDRFEDKGRFSGYLRAVPTQIVTHAYPAFLGLAGLIRQDSRSASE